MLIEAKPLSTVGQYFKNQQEYLLACLNIPFKYIMSKCILKRHFHSLSLKKSPLLRVLQSAWIVEDEDHLPQAFVDIMTAFPLTFL